MHTKDAEDLEFAIKQLSKTERGRNAMRHILNWLDDDGLGLDVDNRSCCTMLLGICWRMPGSGRDAIREAIGN